MLDAPFWRRGDEFYFDLLFPFTRVILPYTPPSTTIPFKKGQGDLAVHIKASCPWEVTSSPSWVRGAGFKGNGNATWHLSVDPNKGDARNGALVISGKTLVVTQESGKCSIGVKAQYAIYDSTGNGVILPYKPATMNGNDPKDLGVHLGSGKAIVAIDVTADYCPWEVTAPDWVYAPSKGTGNTLINANVKANDSSDERTGQILVGDTKISVTQDAAPAEETDCEIALSNKLASFSSSGGNWTVNMTTNPGCAWTATSSVPWAKATKNPSGRGSSVIGYTIEPNTGVLRGGALFINKKLVPLIQEGAPMKEGVSD